MRLDKTVKPPFATGLMWSVTSFAPSCGVLPQYWQVKLSLSKTLNRSLKGVLGLLGFLRTLQNRLLPFGHTGSPANLRALFQEPKCVSYTVVSGNPRFALCKLFRSARHKSRPSRTLASCNFSKRYLSAYFLRPRFIWSIVNKAIKKGKLFFPAVFCCPDNLA